MIHQREGSPKACRENAGENAEQHQCAAKQDQVMAGFLCERREFAAAA
jgi:hypothetical protein